MHIVCRLWYSEQRNGRRTSSLMTAFIWITLTCSTITGHETTALYCTVQPAKIEMLYKHGVLYKKLMLYKQGIHSCIKKVRFVVIPNRILQW